MAMMAVLAIVLALGGAQTWKVPPTSERCPSKWGASDERGSANHMGPGSVLRARELIRTGEVIELAHMLGSNMPFFGTRRFDLHTKRTTMNPQSNREFAFVMPPLKIQGGTGSTVSPAAIR